jgi:hypothetical protein
VNSDCTTGTITIPGDGLTMNIVIVGGGQEIRLTSATSGRVFSGTLRLMAAPTCSASTLSGNSYGFATHGLTTPVPVGFPRIGGFVPFSNMGQISFKADGSVSGVDNVNLGGVFIPGLPIAGTYSVNSDCTGTTIMTIAGNNHSTCSSVFPVDARLTNEICCSSLFPADVQPATRSYVSLS